VQGGTLKQALIEQFSTGTDRRLFVYLDSQRVEAVENGEVVRTFKVSTGKSKTPTVTGSFYIYDRYRHKTMRSDVGRGSAVSMKWKMSRIRSSSIKTMPSMARFGTIILAIPPAMAASIWPPKTKTSAGPMSPRMLVGFYSWAALGLPVTVMHKAPEPMQAGHVPAEESKSANEEVRAVPPEAAAR